MAPLQFSSGTKRAIHDKISCYSSRAIIGRLVAFRRIQGTFKDWIQASLTLTEEGRIEDILLLGRGTFMVLLSTEISVQSLLSRSPLSCGDKLVFLVPWYPGVDLSCFEDRCGVPRFPVKLSFPDLAPEFRVPDVLSQFGSVFGTPFQSSIQLSASVPSLMVAVSPTVDFPADISFEWEGSIISQRMVVTGRPNQCLRCHTIGHLAKDCPKSQRWSRPFRAQHTEVPLSRPREDLSYAAAVRGTGQRQQAGGGAARIPAKPPRQKTAEKPQAVERMVYRRRVRAVEEQQASGRPPELVAHAESSVLAASEQEQPEETHVEEFDLHADTVVRECPGDLAEIVSPVPLAAEQDTGPLSVTSEVADSLVQTVVGDTPLAIPIPPGFVRAVSPPSHFSSESDVPLSQWLPAYFFSVGPWRSPSIRVRDGPLQIQLGFLQFSSRGVPFFRALSLLLFSGLCLSPV